MDLLKAMGIIMISTKNINMEDHYSSPIHRPGRKTVDLSWPAKEFNL